MGERIYFSLSGLLVYRQILCILIVVNLLGHRAITRGKINANIAVAASTLSSRRRAPPLRTQHLSFTQLLPPLCYRDTVLIPFADAKATFAVPRAKPSLPP